MRQHICLRVIMNVVWVCRHFRMVCRVVPSFAQLTIGILPVKAVLRHLQSSSCDLETLKHLQQTTVTQCKPMAQ